MSKKSNNEVGILTCREKTALGLSDEEWIMGCYNAHKNSQCFREHNGHSFCTSCPKNNTHHTQRKDREKIDNKELNPSRSLATKAERSNTELPNKEISLTEASVPKAPIVKTSVPKKNIIEIPITKKLPITEIYKTISVIAKKASVSEEAQKLAKKIVYKAKDKHISIGRRSLKTLSAAILWGACRQLNEKKGQKEIVEAAGVSKCALSLNYSYLRLKLGLPKIKRGRYKKAN
ncbi:hypothetical protein KKA72_00365 [Patescibacteria group bacterium]|nr:hypothetical protein [Patescibacteria group bacterium]